MDAGLRFDRLRGKSDRRYGTSTGNGEEVTPYTPCIPTATVFTCLIANQGETEDPQADINLRLYRRNSVLTEC